MLLWRIYQKTNFIIRLIGLTNLDKELTTFLSGKEFIKF
jgi:hypothetical protein